MPSTAEELSADTRKAASPLVDLRCGLDFRSDMGMDANPKRDQKVREPDGVLCRAVAQLT